MSMHSTPKSRGKKGMVKEDFMKMQQPQMQTVLRVNTQCQCEGCASKIRSILKKTKGVESCKIDLEHGKVTVIGEVDQAKLIDKLSKKTDKQVELWGFPKGMNMNMNNLNNQMKNIHMSVAESGKGGKGNPKPQKKGGDDINFHQMMNGKGGMAGDFKFPLQFKDMKMMPSKDPKSVKFQSSDHDDDESDYESDDDDESFDESDEDHHDGHGHGHSKSSGGKKGFSLSSIPILNRLGSKKEEKKSKKEGKSEGGNKKGEGKKGGDEFQIQKQSGGKNSGKKSGDILEMVKNGGKNGQGKVKGGNNNGGGNNNPNNWTVKGQKGGGGGGGHAMNNMQHKLQDIDVTQLGANVARNPGQMGNYPPGQMGQMGNYPPGHMGQMGNHPTGQMGNYPTGHPGQMGTKNMGQMGNYPTGHPGQMGTKNMGQMGNYPQGQMGNYPQGQMGNYPQGRMGNFQSTEGMIPGMAQTYNPYNNQQQQYMAMMMNQRQQQQAYANGAYNNNMMYGRPMNYGPPPTPPHAMDNHFTQYFNDENTNSCSIM